MPQHQKTTISCRGYQIGEEDTKVLEDQVASLLQKKIIEEVPGDEHPQVLAPAFLVPKADGSKRMVIDFGKINKILQPTSLPLPRMEPLLNALALCRVKSKMDLQQGFYQVALSAESRRLTSFITPSGAIYRYRVLPMGLAASPGVFQQYTSAHVRRFKQNKQVARLVERGAVVNVLMDDFILGSPEVSDHLLLLQLWFDYAQGVAPKETTHSRLTFRNRPL